MLAQRTIQSVNRAVGVGLHSSERVELTLRPAPPDTGIVFTRTDLSEPVEIALNPYAVRMPWWTPAWPRPWVVAT